MLNMNVFYFNLPRRRMVAAITGLPNKTAALKRLICKIKMTINSCRFKTLKNAFNRKKKRLSKVIDNQLNDREQLRVKK